MKPIIFGADDVQAILEGRKTQTRRVIKPQPVGAMKYGTWRVAGDQLPVVILTPTQMIEAPHQPGDVLWVRETFCPRYFDDGSPAYKADYNKERVGDVMPEPKWRPSIHMPRKAARIFLRVKSVRVERVQEISVADAIAEGMRHGTCDIQSCIPCIYGYGCPGRYADNEFAEQWESIYRKRGHGWNTNPWVWVYEFERISKEEAYGK